MHRTIMSVIALSGLYSSAHAEMVARISVSQPAACYSKLVSASADAGVLFHVACNTDAVIELRSSNSFDDSSWVELDDQRAKAGSVVVFPLSAHPKGRMHSLKFSPDISISDFTVAVRPANH